MEPAIKLAGLLATLLIVGCESANCDFQCESKKAYIVEQQERIANAQGDQRIMLSAFDNIDRARGH